MKKILAAVVAVSALWVSGAPVARAADPIVIKFSHVVTNETPKGRGSLLFKKLVEEALPGRVVVEVYPNSQLYKDKEELEALQLGAVQMLAPSLSKFGPLGIKEYEALDLPFILVDDKGYHAVTDGPVGKMMFDKLETKGIHGLAYWDNGFQHMAANKPLRSPTDMQGLKMRIQSSKVVDATMRAVGALPQVMPFSELYQGLQTGVVDGCDASPSNFYTQKLPEVQKFMTLTNHNHLGYAVIVNKAFWDGLPADVRVVLEKAMKQSTDFVNQDAVNENKTILAKMKADGKPQIIELTPQERTAWVKAMMPVHKEMASRVGQDTIDAVYKASGFVAP